MRCVGGISSGTTLAPSDSKTRADRCTSLAVSGSAPSKRTDVGTPTVFPRMESPIPLVKSGTGTRAVVGSRGSCPAMAFNSSAQSSTDRAIGPAWSRLHARGISPALLTRPNVGLIPTVPHSEDGMRMEPPVSEPVAPRHIPEARAAPDPPLDPPGIRVVSHGFDVGGVHTPY